MNAPHSPSPRPLLVVWAALLVLALLAVELELAEAAYQKLGIPPRAFFALLGGSLLGSHFNIPVAWLRDEEVVSARDVRILGLRYVLPAVERARGTLVAVNVGGAVIPVATSVWLLATGPGSWWGPLAVVAAVTLVVHRLARPIRGLGIAVPVWIPPLAAAGAALLLAPEAPARAAYVGGTLGCLIGGDLLNLGRLRGLGAPLASIGGAGTFDGIFVTGILAALIA